MREFLDTYAALLLRFSRLELGEQRETTDAEDVAHEVIVTLLRMHAEGSFDPHALERPEAYLRVVVRNAARRARRRGRRAGELTSQGTLEEVADQLEPVGVEAVPTPEQLTGEALDARQTLNALKRRLRPRDAAAFALLVEDGLSIEDTAAALGTTSNNVYQMRHRISAAARELVLEQGDGPVSLVGGRS